MKGNNYQEKSASVILSKPSKIITDPVLVFWTHFVLK